MMQYIVKRMTRFGIEKGAFNSLDEAKNVKILLEEEGEFVFEIETENGEIIY